MASPWNRHCASSIGTLSQQIVCDDTLQLMDAVSSGQVLQWFLCNKPAAVIEQTHMSAVWCRVLPTLVSTTFSLFCCVAWVANGER